MADVKYIRELSDAESQRLMELFSKGIASALRAFKDETGIHISGSGADIDLYAEARQIVLNHR